MRVAVILVATGVIVSCTVPATNPTTSQAPGVTSTSATAPPDVTGAPGLGCPQNADFASDGQVMRVDQPESDTGTVGLITWRVDGGCEVFQIDFETAEGAPATTPPSVTVEYLESHQVLRIGVSADQTIITDQIVETDLVDRLFVVQALDGSMFIDLHLRGPSQARARISNSPARVFVELQRGLTPLLGQSATSDRTVLTGPWEGATVATNLEVTGYARTSDDQVMIIATSGRDVAVETTTATADSAYTWAEFKTRIDIPTGETSIFVGDQDPEDGSLAGVNVRVSTR